MSSTTALRWSSRVWAGVLAVACCARVGVAQVAVTTQHNDNHRTGANLRESALRPATVTPAAFGKLFVRQVDGEVYAQPLYVPGVQIPGKGSRNVVLVATMNNSVYAFDADDPDARAPLWTRNFGPAVPQADVQCCCRDISTKIGILGTPVVDPATGTLYLISRNKVVTPFKTTYRQRLHALNLATGTDRVPERLIAATYRGIPFDPRIHNQRSALTLHDGRIYAAWASHNDCGPYRGWVMAFRANDLALEHVWNTAPEPRSGMAGIWQSGQGLTVDDDGYLHLMTGNGTFNAATGGESFGCSFVKLSPSLVVADWFTPSNVDFLNAVDADLGSSGVLAIPGMKRVTGIGKDGRLYLLDPDRMGRFFPDKNDVVQSFGAVDGHVHGSPVYFDSPENGPSVYLWSEEDNLKVFALREGKFVTEPLARSAARVPGGMPGAMLSVTADGATPGSGILWASHPLTGNANQAVVPGMLRAYDAAVFTGGEMRELWNSEADPADRVGNFAKFCAPTVADGKVFLATFGQPTEAIGSSGQLVVYGLKAGTRPGIPQRLRATPDVASIRLDWDPTPNATSYTLLRGATPDSLTPYQSGLTTPTHTDTAVTDGATYVYQVVAVGPGGQSGASNTVSAKILPRVLPVYPVADASVSSLLSGINLGASSLLTLRLDGQADQRIAYLTFDLGAVTARIDTVTLRLYGGAKGAPIADTLYAVADTTWAENRITWVNRPATGAVLGVRTVTPDAPKFYEWDVTAHVKAELAAGRARIGFAVGPTTPPILNKTWSHSFNAREAGGNRPELSIRFQTP